MRELMLNCRARSSVDTPLAAAMAAYISAMVQQLSSLSMKSCSVGIALALSALNFSPSRRQGFMSGSMTLICIYKRSED